MADEVKEPVHGDGYAVANIEALGDQYGFRKIRRALDVKAFGMNAVAIPPGYAAPRHSHEEQEETYFVHRGTVAMEFGDGSTHVLGPGGVARVDASTVRQVRNISEEEDAVYVIAGGKDGYVGRDGKLPEGEASPRAEPGG